MPDGDQREEQLLHRAAVPPRDDPERRSHEDGREDQDRDAVADAALRDQLADPHEQNGAGREGDDDEHHLTRAGVQRALAAEEKGVAGRLRGGEDDREVPRVLRDLRVACLALPLQLTEPWDHHGHQLQDDRRRDVRHDPEREEGELRERASREEVEEARGPCRRGSRSSPRWSASRRPGQGSTTRAGRRRASRP